MKKTVVILSFGKWSSRDFAILRPFNKDLSTKYKLTRSWSTRHYHYIYQTRLGTQSIFAIKILTCYSSPFQKHCVFAILMEKPVCDLVSWVTLLPAEVVQRTNFGFRFFGVISTPLRKQMPGHYFSAGTNNSWMSVWAYMHHKIMKNWLPQDHFGEFYSLRL